MYLWEPEDGEKDLLIFLTRILDKGDIGVLSLS